MIVVVAVVAIDDDVVVVVVLNREVWFREMGWAVGGGADEMSK